MLSSQKEERQAVTYRRPPKRYHGGRAVPVRPTPKEETVYGLVYCRVSSMTQAIEGHGLDSQELRCIKELSSIEVPHEKSFLDSFTGSGDFMKRPAMHALLAYIDAHPHRKYVVVFDDLKRFARDVIFHLKLRAAFRARNVKLRCLNFNFDDTPEGEFVEVVMAGQAQLERQQNRRQVIQKQKARLEAGYWPFGPKKGYMHIRDKAHGVLAVPTQEGREVLKAALEMYAFGVFTTKIEACKYLIEKGFWTKHKPNRYVDKFAWILRDPFYCGDISYERWEVARREGHHEGIISREVFALIERRLGKKEGDGAKLRVDTSPDFPMRGLVVCAKCGGHITAAWSKGKTKRYGYYFCQQSACGSKTIPRAKVEDEFCAVLEQNHLKADIAAIRITFNVTLEEELALMENNALACEQEKKSLADKIEKLTSAALSAKSDELRQVYEAQIEGAAQKVKGLENVSLGAADSSTPYQTAFLKAATFLKHASTIWQNTSAFEKHNLYFLIFSEKIAYERMAGYQTAKTPSSTVLFEAFAETNPLDVEMARIALASKEGDMNVSTRPIPSCDLSDASKR